MKRIASVLLVTVLFLMTLPCTTPAAELPNPVTVKPIKLFTVPHYCEGVVFDHQGNGYLSEDKNIVKFSLDGRHTVWATTGAPNGHRVLGDGTHLVCDASRHAVLHLDAHGKVLGNASDECDGKPLRKPNDLSLDPRGGFYFTDPGGSNDKTPIGTVHYVDSHGTTHLVDSHLAFPNGIVLVPGGKRLLVGESKHNRILEYAVAGPGQLGRRRVFTNLPTKQGDQIDNQPDGMCLDAAGNLYVAHYGMRQVQVLNPHGKLITRYAAGNLSTSNVAFGGPRMDQLFVTGGLGKETGGGGLFRLNLGVKGLVILPAHKRK